MQKTRRSSSENTHQAPTILLVTTCWWPAFARFAQLLMQGGARVAMICPPGHPVRKLPGITIFEQSAFTPLGILRSAIAACSPSLIVPGDERALRSLHRLYRTGTEAHRALIETSLGAPAGYGCTSSRIELLNLAKKLGIPTPDFTPVTTQDMLQDWLSRSHGPWVLKAEHTWGGMGVRITRTRAQALAAYEELRGQPGRGTAVKRALINRDVFWLADLVDGRRPALMAQAYVGGRPGDLAMFCHSGKIISAVMAEMVLATHETGPATLVRLVRRDDFMAAATRLAAELQLSGYYGLDFMIDEASNEARLIELNPRPTALTNIVVSGHDVVMAPFASMYRNPAPVRIGARTGDLVAYFPGSPQLRQNNPLFHGAFQDIPYETPELMEEMQKERWPERHFVARLHQQSSKYMRQILGGLNSRPDAAAIREQSRAAVPREPLQNL